MHRGIEKNICILGQPSIYVSLLQFEELHCNPGLIFDATMGYCNWPEQVDRMDDNCNTGTGVDYIPLF